MKFKKSQMVYIIGSAITGAVLNLIVRAIENKEENT
jgi:hypothetical protein